MDASSPRCVENLARGRNVSTHFSINAMSTAAIAGGRRNDPTTMPSVSCHQRNERARCWRRSVSPGPS